MNLSLKPFFLPAARCFSWRAPRLSLAHLLNSAILFAIIIPPRQCAAFDSDLTDMCLNSTRAALRVDITGHPTTSQTADGGELEVAPGQPCEWFRNCCYARCTGKTARKVYCRMTKPYKIEKALCFCDASSRIQVCSTILSLSLGVWIIMQAYMT